MRRQIVRSPLYISIYCKNAVIMQDCHSELKHKVSIRGTYNSHECGIEISGFEARDAGRWTCEMEEYVLMGKRGSGDRDNRSFTVGLLSTTTTTTTSSTSTTSSTTSTFSFTNSSTSSSRTPVTTTTPLITEMTTVETTVTSQPGTEAEDSTDQHRTREETTELSSPDQAEQEDLDGETTNVTEKFVQSDEEVGRA